MSVKYDNSGIISENDRKQQPNHPDFKGQITVEGREYWLSGWEKNGSKGPFISLSVKPKEDQAPQQSKPKSSLLKGSQEYKNKEAPTGFDEQDSDIPF